MSTPDIERPDIVEQARAALSDWHEACARMDEVDADPDLEHEDRRHAQDTVTEAALEAVWLLPDLVAEAERLRGELDRVTEVRDTRDAAIAALAEWRTKPDPDQPGRCPSIEPDDTLQCGRAIHDDDQCRLGGIGWLKGTPKNWTHRERAMRMERMAEMLAERLVDVSSERDRSRDFAARLEADGVRLVERIDGLIAEWSRECDEECVDPDACTLTPLRDLLAEHRAGDGA